MVYCGKPSQSCEACRKIKTKCDRKHPACGQCTRVGRVCPGYRDLDSVIFRDETVKLRVNSKHAKKTRDTRSSPLTSISTCPAIIRSPLTNRRDQAIGTFLLQYATGIEGCYDYVFDVIYEQNTAGVGVLYDTMELVGLAYLSGVRFGRHGLTSCEIEVYKKHSLAIESVNQALSDSSQATKDETLISVILLGLFESVTCMAPKSLHIWKEHVRGATALVQARGLQQFDTLNGRRILAHLLDFIMIYTIQRYELIPDEIVKIAMLPCTVQTPAEVAHQELFRIYVDIAKTRHLRHYRSAAAETLVPQTKSIDDALKRWMESAPKEYAFTTAPAVPNQRTLNGVYHLYPNPCVARTWATYYMGLLLNTELMIRLYSTMEKRSWAGDLAIALDRQHGLCADVCNSVAFYLSCPNPQAVVGITVLWPLYSVAAINNVTTATRLWALQQMRDISMRTVSMQGIHFSEALMEQWGLASNGLWV